MSLINKLFSLFGYEVKKIDKNKVEEKDKDKLAEMLNPRVNSESNVKSTSLIDDIMITRKLNNLKLDWADDDERFFR